MQERLGRTHDDIIGTAHLDTEPGVLTISHLYRLLAECFNTIERKHLDTPDLYRAAGNKEEVDALYQYYWNYGRLDMGREPDCMSLASLAKTAVRRLTEQRESSLFSDALLEKLNEYFKTCGLEFTSARKDKICELLEKHSSPQQLSVIMAIITHLSILVRRSPDCTCQSLEVCWNPTLLGPYRFLGYGSVVRKLISTFA